jgi:hypothetical protein
MENKVYGKWDKAGISVTFTVSNVFAAPLPVPGMPVESET